MSRAGGIRRFLRNTLDGGTSADENNQRYWEATRAGVIDPFILPPAEGVVPPGTYAGDYVTQEPLNDLDSSTGDDSRQSNRSNRRRILSTPYPGAASLPRTGQPPLIQPNTSISPQPPAPGVVPTFAPHSRQPVHLSANSPWPPSGTGWFNNGGVATHRSASSMGPVIPNLPLRSGRRQRNRNRRSNDTGLASSISSQSSDRRRRSRTNPVPEPPRDIAKDRARELHEAEQAVNAAKKVREATHARAVAMAETDAYRRAGIQVAPIPNTTAVALSSQASLLPGVQHSAPFASSSSHLGHGQPMFDTSVPARHNSQPVYTYGNINNSKPSKGFSSLFRRKSAPPKSLLKDVFPQPPNMARSNIPQWNGYPLVPPPVQDPTKPLILMAGVPPPDGYKAVAYGPVQQPQQAPAPTPRNVPNIPMPPERTDVPVDEEPVIPNLHKSGSGTKHHMRKPTLLESTGIGPIIADPAQVAYLPVGPNASMMNVANPTEVGGIESFPWSDDIDWAERPKKRSVLDHIKHIKEWANGTELSNHPDPITATVVYPNAGVHPSAIDLARRKKSQSEKLDLLEDDDGPIDHRQASYNQLTGGGRPSVSFTTTGGSGPGGRSKANAVHFSENRGHELYPFCLSSEHTISWGGAIGPTALHWYESGRFEVAGYGLGTDGMGNAARPSEWIENGGPTRRLMRSLLGNAGKERTRKEEIELTRAATGESRIVLDAPDMDTLTTLSNQFKSEGRQRSDWDAVWKPKLYEILYLKFTQHESLRGRLLETHPRPIVFRNIDKFLGDGMDGTGANELGQALEHIRGILLHQVLSTTPKA